MAKEKVISLGEYRHYKQTGIKLNNFKKKLEETKEEKKIRLKQEREKQRQIDSYNMTREKGPGMRAGDQVGIFFWLFFFLILVLSAI